MICGGCLVLGEQQTETLHYKGASDAGGEAIHITKIIYLQDESLFVSYLQ